MAFHTFCIANYDIQVKAEIEKKLAVCKRMLKSLGAERDTADKQAQYLFDVATEFQRIVGLSVKADYGSDNIFDELTELRLATKLVDCNEEFARDMEEFGHQYQFQKDPSQEEVITEDLSWGVSSTEEQSNYIVTRRIGNALELNEVLYAKDELAGPSPLDILDWLKSMHSNSWGFELGTFASTLLPAAMRQQANKWKAMASGYTSDVIALVHGFVTTLLQSLCGDDQVSERLLNLLLDSLLEKYSRSLEHVKFLVDVELSGVPMTLNHYFNDNLEKW